MLRNQTLSTGRINPWKPVCLLRWFRCQNTCHHCNSMDTRLPLDPNLAFDVNHLLDFEQFHIYS